MTFNECKLCFYLFCTYYNGKTIKDIPNNKGLPENVEICTSKLKIENNGHVTTFNSPDSIFWFSGDCSNEFSLDYTIDYTGENRYYSSVEDFLNYFEIPFKDIV